MRFISTLNNGKCFILRDLFILNYWTIIKTLKKLIVICGRNINIRSYLNIEQGALLLLMYD